MKKALASVPLLRTLVIKGLKYTSFDFRITNPWSKHKLFLNSYRHKGYWYAGNRREQKTMAFFRDQISEGDTAIDIGGHIGFITQYFSSLVGETGRVVVFEPGLNNLQYIKRNVESIENIELERMAVSNTCGTTVFYEDNVTGQNNSLEQGFKGAEEVAKAHREILHRRAEHVEVTRLDTYLEERNIKADFVKIDVESSELQVLEGMEETLKTVSSLMVEVTKNQIDVSKILVGSGFVLRDEQGTLHASIPSDFYGNLFATRD